MATNDIGTVPSTAMQLMLCWGSKYSDWLMKSFQPIALIKTGLAKINTILVQDQPRGHFEYKIQAYFNWLFLPKVGISEA